MLRTSKIALICAAALAAVGLSGAVAQETQPHVSLARDLVADASAFETYTRTAGAIDARFASPQDIAQALRVAASHDPRQLEAGMVAYAAMAALQDPAFVSGVQRAMADPQAREALVRQLIDNPDAVLALPGAEGATMRARSALLRQVEPLITDGVRVKQAAYDIQHRDWSKAMVQDAPQRLALVKKLAAQSFAPDEADANRLFQSVAVEAESRAGTPGPVVVRGLALAVMALAGDTDEEHAEAFAPLLTEARSAYCVHMAKLNLFQCMAVAGPHYEDIFCLSQHAMLEPAQCIAKAAGAEVTLAATQTAQAAPPSGVRFPIAGHADNER
jgi:hypothetical protein